MSPEQVGGKSDLDERSDVYALGVVLYECVTGSVPFDAPSLPALSIKIFEGRYTPPRDIQRDAPDGLDELVARAMAVEPSTRYQTMNEFKAALERFAATPISLSTTLASAEGLPTAQQGGPAGASQQRTVPLASESSPPDAPRVATSSPPHTRTTGGVSAATEPKAPGRGRRALVVGIGVAVAAGVAIALGSTKAPPTVTPDDEEAARRSADRSPAAPSPPPVPAPAPLVSSELSAPTASAVVDAGATVPPVPSAIDASRPRAPKPRPSASSRAARDGLTEENPF
jgi:serine/threonine-protein kinase